MVPLEHGQYLIDIMVELRPTRQDGMGGVHCVDWSELRAFGKVTGLLTEPWEYRVLMKMCKAYLNGWYEGKEVLSISPMERDKNDG